MNSKLWHSCQFQTPRLKELGPRALDRSSYSMLGVLSLFDAVVQHSFNFFIVQVVVLLHSTAENIANPMLDSSNTKPSNNEHNKSRFTTSESEGINTLPMRR